MKTTVITSAIFAVGLFNRKKKWKKKKKKKKKKEKKKKKHEQMEGLVVLCQEV